MQNGDIWWSVDEENYIHSSLDELLDSEWDNHDWLGVGSTVYYGEIVIPNTNFIDADDVIDIISERAYEEGREYADNYPDCDEKDRQDLQEFLKQWQSRFTPSFFRIKKSKEYTITEYDAKRFKEND